MTTYTLDTTSGLFNSETRTKTDGPVTYLEAEAEKVLADFISPNNGLFDSGLLPIGSDSGLLSLRGGFGHIQIVYQFAPQIRTVIWGERERDPDAVFYQLAMPYYLVVADFYNKNLSGVRHFYSPVPFVSWDTPLYHTNLPNTNCKGYTNGVGVGWVCLYHTDDTSDYTTGQLITYALRRVSGEEPYNNRNMAETDGTRLYAAHKKPAYFCNPTTWQEKSLAEGCEWTCDPELLIPVLVEGIDKQSCGNVEKGYHLTLFDAVNGTYKSYYEDTQPLKPISAATRGLPLNPSYAKRLETTIKRFSQPGSGPVMLSRYTKAFSSIRSLATSKQFSCVSCGSPSFLGPDHAPLYAAKTFPNFFHVFSSSASKLDTLQPHGFGLICSSCRDDKAVPFHTKFLAGIAETTHKLPDVIFFLDYDKWVFLIVRNSATVETYSGFFPIGTAFTFSCPNCGRHHPNATVYRTLGFPIEHFRVIGEQHEPVSCNHCCPDFEVELTSGEFYEAGLLQSMPLPDGTVAYVLKDKNLEDTVVCACKRFAATNVIDSSFQGNDPWPTCSTCIKDGAYVPFSEALSMASVIPSTETDLTTLF